MRSHPTGGPRGGAVSRKFGFEQLQRQVLDYVEAEVECWRSEAKGDSEIEKLFYYALQMKIKFGETEYTTLGEPDDNGVRGFDWLCEHCQDPYQWLIMRRQVPLQDRRVDFIISVFDWSSGRCGRNVMDVLPGKDRKWCHLVIECDGHDYHERTKEQATRDRARDRKAILDGMDFFRFTGSELWRDPWGCTEQVIDWARNITFPREK